MSTPAVLASSLVGLAGGVLIPPVAYRFSVPAGEPLRSSCVSCGEPLGGWAQRCGGCGERQGPHAWLAALLGAVVCGLLAFAIGPSLVLPLYVAMGLLGVLLGAIDVACKRLPHNLVVPAIVVSALGFTLTAAVSGEWSDLLRAVLAGLVLGGAFLALFLLPGQGMGFGDVKLAVLLGGFLGWLGWREVILGGLLPWLVNAPVVIFALLTGRAGRKSRLPFGPALLVGALLAVLVSAWLRGSVGPKV